MLPNYVLVLGAPKSGKFTVAKHIAQVGELVGENISHSGYIMKAKVETKYFTLELSLLIDEFPEDGRERTCSDDEKVDGFGKWYQEFASDECEELRNAVEGIVFCVDVEGSLEYVEGVLDILDDIRETLGDSWEGFIVVVGKNGKVEEKVEDVEDAVILHAMEFINFSESGINQYKEKVGKDRLLEVFESHQWANLAMKKHDDYDQNKRDKLAEMTEGLLDKEKDNEKDQYDNEQDEPQGKFNISKQNANLDITEIFEKMKLAKSNMEGMNEQQKQVYANKMIKEIIDFI